VDIVMLLCHNIYIYIYIYIYMHVYRRMSTLKTTTQGHMYMYSANE
jgi:hypothetical protein